MNELTRIQDAAMLEAQESAAQEMRRMSEMLATMAAMLQATTESMEQLRRQVRLLEKVTPAQAGEINRAVRERAQALCRLYGAPGGEKSAAAAIRKAMRLQLGAATTREIPRCDYEIALEAARGWDDYKVMRGIRDTARRGGA